MSGRDGNRTPSMNDLDASGEKEYNSPQDRRNDFASLGKNVTSQYVKPDDEYRDRQANRNQGSGNKDDFVVNKANDALRKSQNVSDRPKSPYKAQIGSPYRDRYPTGAKENRTHEVVGKATETLKKSQNLGRQSTGSGASGGYTPSKSPMRHENIIDATLKKSQDLRMKSVSPSPNKPFKNNNKIMQEIQRSQDLAVALRREQDELRKSRGSDLKASGERFFESPTKRDEARKKTWNLATSGVMSKSPDPGKLYSESPSKNIPSVSPQRAYHGQLSSGYGLKNSQSPMQKKLDEDKRRGDLNVYYDKMKKGDDKPIEDENTRASFVHQHTVTSQGLAGKGKHQSHAGALYHDHIQSAYEQAMARSEKLLAAHTEDVITRKEVTTRELKKSQGKIPFTNQLPTENQVQSLERSYVLEKASGGESPSKAKNHKLGNSLKTSTPPGFFDPKHDEYKPKNVEEYAEDGTVYKGDKINGLRQGKGTFTYPDGTVYEGEWQTDYRQGYGILKRANGEIVYEGEWAENQFQGNGTLYNYDPRDEPSFDWTDFNNLGSAWIKYEGEFWGGQRDGLGSYYMVNGDRFVGKFKGNNVHGTGTYYKKDGRNVAGEWNNNKFVKSI